MTPTMTDLFAGAGGSSTGATTAGVDVRIAANHWQVAIDTHQANHPTTDHDCADISQVDPRRYPRTDLLWASPSCTHHSRAQGKRRSAPLTGPSPRTLTELIELEPDRSRATMHDVIRFSEHHRYEAVFVENVPEVRDWPLFPYWLDMMTKGLGYHYRPVILNAADADRHGPAVAQTRERWFGVFTRSPLAIEDWPTDHRLPVSSALDPSPGPLWESKPRADSTRAKVAATLDRFPDEDRWIISYYGASRVGRPVSEPVGTLTTRDRHAVLTRVDGQLHFRMLNRMEQVRIMGFPESYLWTGSGTDITKQIGNAVVPACARDIVAEVLAHA